MDLEGGVSVDTLEGSVLTLVIDNLHRDAEFIAIDEQANHDSVPLGGFGEADRLAHQAFDPGAERQVLAFDLLSLALTWAMSRRHQRPLIGTPMVSG
jgi:hypothetical protein